MASIVRAVVAAIVKSKADFKVPIDLLSSDSVVLINADQLKLNIRSQDQWQCAVHHTGNFGPDRRQSKRTLTRLCEFGMTQPGF